MQPFLDAHREQIQGVLHCFDRMIFRGYLPVQWGEGMARFLWEHNIGLTQLKPFLLKHAAAVKSRAIAMASETGRPYRYLEQRIRMEDEARAIAERDKIKEGLVCIFGVMEPCRTFAFRQKDDGHPFVQSAHRKCVMLYYYFLDPQFGLMHIRIQTWFPLQVQIYVNGHEWLTRQLDARGVRYRKVDNALVWVEDLVRAQALSDRFVNLPWPKILDQYAKRVNPFMGGLLAGYGYYWCTAQSEYSTDILFKSAEHLRELAPRLVQHAAIYLGAREIMSFLGRKLHGNFAGDITASVKQPTHLRIPGMRIKHRVKGNWLKMYDKAGSVLRVEMVINQPEEFRVRRRVRRHGRRRTEWVEMRKGVGFMFRYREVSKAANERYLGALAHVEDPTASLKALDHLTSRKELKSGQKHKPFNPLAREDTRLFEALLSGDHCVRGFTNRDVRAKLGLTPEPAPSPSPGTATTKPKQAALAEQQAARRRASAHTSRLLARCRAFGLVAKVPRSRRWRVTADGRQLMATAIRLRTLEAPRLLATG